MRKIQMLGFDCVTCRKTHTRIAALIDQHDIAASVEKIDDPHALLGYRVMAPSEVVIDGCLVYCGGLSSRRQIETWLLERHGGGTIWRSPGLGTGRVPSGAADRTI